VPETRADSSPATRRVHQHDVLVHDSPDELLAVAVPFLRAGLAADESAVIATTAPITQALRDALGDDAGVLVLDRDSVYGRRTPSTITAFRRLTEERTRAGSQGVRVVAEPDFGPTPRHWLEWQRYEAVINEALRGLPLWGLCAYDTSRLPDEVVESGRRTHRHVVTTEGRRPSPEHQDPAEYLRSLPVPAEPLQDGEPLLRVDDVTDFVGLRHAVGERLAGLGGEPDLVEDVHLAIDEIASNAVRHGAPPIQLTLWGSADRVVCTISDRGPGLADPFAGYGPAHGTDLSRGGMGLWLARELCDHVDVLDDGAGLTVRLATALR
jgi:anti-sigma regulatory factor (Ser/Thr protein kinase)